MQTPHGSHHKTVLPTLLLLLCILNFALFLLCSESVSRFSARVVSCLRAL